MRTAIIEFPVEASVGSRAVDELYLTLVGISFLVVLAVFGLILFFSIRYRAGSSANRGPLPAIFSHDLEIGWTLATLLAFLAMYAWAVSVRQVHFSPPPGALNIRVIAKQWMWKFEHPTGAREIDTLHLPLGIPVRLSMTSQDVIHSFYVPAFREKQDVLPDRIVTLWFTPSEPGEYAIRCAQYCGTNHSLMEGQVIVMPAPDYAHWANVNADNTLPQAGARAFSSLGCAGCHEGNLQRAPQLANLYGRKVSLNDGRTITADETYLERSILDPRADIVKGYLPIMPAYRGVATPDEVSALVAYLKTLRSEPKS